MINGQVFSEYWGTLENYFLTFTIVHLNSHYKAQRTFSRGDAEPYDILQSAAEVAIEKFNTKAFFAKPKDEFRNYVLKIIEFKINAYYESERSSQAKIDFAQDEIKHLIANVYEMPEESYANKDNFSSIMRATNEFFTESELKLIYLSKVENLPRAEIADIYGKSHQSIRTQISRLNKKLRQFEKLMKKQGLLAYLLALGISGIFSDFM